MILTINIQIITKETQPVHSTSLHRVIQKIDLKKVRSMKNGLLYVTFSKQKIIS